MPTSKETRVRVEGFSKIIASVLPASGLPRPAAPSCRRAALQDAAQRRGIEIVEVEEVPGASAGSPEVMAPARGRTLSSMPMASSTSASVMISGGSRRTTLSPAPTVSRPRVAQLVHDRRR